MMPRDSYTSGRRPIYEKKIRRQHAALARKRIDSPPLENEVETVRNIISNVMRLGFLEKVASAAQKKAQCPFCDSPRRLPHAPGCVMIPVLRTNQGRS